MKNPKLDFTLASSTTAIKIRKLAINNIFPNIYSPFITSQYNPPNIITAISIAITSGLINFIPGSSSSPNGRVIVIFGNPNPVVVVSSGIVVPIGSVVVVSSIKVVVVSLIPILLFHTPSD